MPRKTAQGAASAAQLQMKVDAITKRTAVVLKVPTEERVLPDGQIVAAVAAVHAEPPEPTRDVLPMEMREPFGSWLLAQRDRGDWIDDLATAARTDRGFPRNGSPEDVRKRLQSFGADGDAFEQVDDAERDWLIGRMEH